jgi:hypothetical protein
MAINTEMDGSRQLDRQGRRDHGGAPGPWQRLTRVSHYWRSGPSNSTRFSPSASWRCGELNSLTLGRQRMVVAACDGEAVRLASVSTLASSSAPPVKMKAPKGAVVFDGPSGMFDSARAAAHWHGGELHTVVSHPVFKTKTRCSSYVCPGSSCHTYGQNVSTEYQCLYYIVSYYKKNYYKSRKD